MTQSVNSLFNDRYELIRLIGKGTTGLVYLAYDNHLDREVAIKVVDPNMAKNKEVLIRFDQEVRITARLQHPGVVAVFESGLSQDQMPCYAMGLAMGETLEEFLDKLRELESPWEEFKLIERLNAFMKLLEVMEYAHSQSVVHRDLKPANIVMGEYGEVRVLDWGLGRVLTDDEDDEVVSEFDDLFGDEENGGTSRIRSVDGKRSTRVSQRGDSTKASQPNIPVKRNVTDQFAETLVPGEALPPDPSEDISGEYPKQNWYKDYEDQTDNLRPNTDLNPHTTTDVNHHSTSTSNRRDSSTNTSTSRNRRTGRFDSVSIERRTRHGEILGSPVYMSPEQARGEADRADRRTDIYSLGVILFEFLTLETPQQIEAGEHLQSFIDRIISGKHKRRLENLWEDAPKALCRICKKALSRSVSRRYRNCGDFMDDINQLLEELSASYSELERQRLERERQGAWIPVGNWEYTDDQKTMKPFTEMVTAFEGEAVGQMINPERGGLMLGGCGLQIYPCAVNVGDDIRISMEFSFLHGNELWVFLRGMPPVSCYAFRIGSYNGQWLTVSRIQSVEKIFQPEMLTMRALTEEEVTMSHARTKTNLKRHLVIEVVESSLRISIDGNDPLEVQDPCPLMGPMHQQLAIGTMGSQIVLNNFTVEQRRSPLMMPSYTVANELLRQKLYPQAITFYQRFLEEQHTNEGSVEAHFMLCLAFLEAGHVEQSEAELHNFLLENIDNKLSRDAIFELARLRTGNDYKSIERGVRVVLSYQEADDRVRSRFCLWASQLLHDTIFLSGIDKSVIEALRLLKHLIRGFSDEDVLLSTISEILVKAMEGHAARLIDFQAHDQLVDFKKRARECRKQGYEISPVYHRSPNEYVEIARKISSLDMNNLDEEFGIPLRDSITPRDIMCLNALGASEPLLRLLETREDAKPVIRLCMAALYARAGKQAESQTLLDESFRLMDIIEHERTNIELTTVMRLGMFGMQFLPWDVVWPPISQMAHEPELQVLAAWLAECLGFNQEAAEAYFTLRETEALGFRNVVEQGLARLGMLADADDN